MPLVLLLKDITKAFADGAKKLRQWSEMAFLEELVLQRARSAFLVYWFGTSIPLYGMRVRVAISNLDALRDRYRGVVHGRRMQPRGLNLTEPLAGLAGTMAGIILSPSGIILTNVAAIQSGNFLVGLMVIGGAGLLALVGGLVAAFPAWGIPILGGLLGAGALGVATNASAQQMYRFFGALAEALDAGMDFLDQLLGPRENVRNPLVRAFLDLADKVAQALTHLVGGVAVIVARGGEMIRPLREQLPLFHGLAQEVIVVIAEILKDFLERLFDALIGPRSPLRIIDYVLDGLRNYFTLVKDLFTSTLDGAQEHFESWSAQSFKEIDKWGIKTYGILETHVRKHPTARGIEIALDRYRLVEKIMGPLGSSGASSAGGGASTGGTSTGGTSTGGTGGGSSILPDAGVVSLLSGPPALPLTGKSIQVGAGLRAFARQYFPQAFANPFEITPEMKQAFFRARRRRTVFAAERRRLRDRQGRSPQEQLEALRARELPLRNALYQIVANVLPAQATPYVVELDDVFRQIDEHLYLHPPEPRDFEPPVREILESRRLQPVVHRLRIRRPGGEQDVTERWTEGLRSALETQSYVASQ